jgi:NADPH:quinone reductase-like Zn-dependent oxidoreductase
MPIPPCLSYVEAAALPEAALTSWTNLVIEGHLEDGKSVLITGAASGIGTFAVQLAHGLGAEVVVAGRSLERLERLRPLGAQHCVVLAEGMPDAVRMATEQRGADLAMDLVGGRWLPTTLASLADRGRLVLVGLMDGGKVEIDLADVLRRRLTIRGSVLRGRTRTEKRELVTGFRAFADERLADGSLKPVVDHVAPFERIVDAYGHMAEGGQFGKIVIEI